MAMRFEHEFSIPVPVEQAWAVLLDVERIAPCLPGASLDEVEGDAFSGRMKVKVGPITVTYKGTAAFEEVDKDAYSLRLKAGGKEARGSGTADATVDARLTPEGDGTKVTIETVFNVTGRPAQFGRGVMQEVGGKLIDRFAQNLAEQLASDHDLPAPDGERLPETGHGSLPQNGERHLAAVPDALEDLPAPPREPAGSLRTSRTPDEEALDLLEIAGTPLLKRVAPVVGVVAFVLVIAWLIRRIFR